MWLMECKPWFAGKQGKPWFAGKQDKPWFAGKQDKPWFAGKQDKPWFAGKQDKPWFAGKQGKPWFAGKQGKPWFAGKQGKPWTPEPQNLSKSQIKKILWRNIMVNKSILVVDDVQDWRDQLKSILKRSGYTVDTAKDYPEALEKIKYGQAELVIVDLRLDPVDEDNRDGMKLLEVLEKKRINALVLSGYGTSPLMEQAKLLQAVGFLKKNISLKKLREVVKVIFSEIEKRDLNRAVETRKFYRGEIVGYPPEAAGYPLQESLNQKIEQLVE